MSALVLRSDQSEFDQLQLAALRQMGVDQAEPADQALFLHQCQRTGLDPFARQIYMIGRWDKKSGRTKYTIQTSIDGLRLIAERTGLYRGAVPVMWCGPDGEWRNVWLSEEPPAAAMAGVLREGFDQPMYAVAMWREFVQDTPMWRSKGAHMLAKVAEAHALRRAFPQDLSGLYSDDEMPATPPPAAAVAGRQTVQQQPAAGRRWGPLLQALDRLAQLRGEVWDDARKKREVLDVLQLDPGAGMADLSQDQIDEAARVIGDTADYLQANAPVEDAEPVEEGE